jgi:hypothetical protein
MISLTIDDTSRVRLNQPRELAEERDNDGNVIGFFVPTNLYKARLHIEAFRNTDFVKIFQGNYVTSTGHTTRQVFERLNCLTDNEAELTHLQEKNNRFIEDDKDFLSRV